MSAPAPSPFHMIFSPTYNENELGNEYRSSEGYGSSKEAEDADDDHLYSDLDEPSEGKDGSRKRDISPNKDICHLYYSDDNIDHNSHSLSTSREELPIALARIAELEEEVKKLKSENESYLKEKSVLEKNFSSLLMTARANLERKDRQLKELQKEFDNVVFRRGKANNRISHETIEKLVEEKARAKVEAAMKAIPKETKDGDVVDLKDHTNCQVAMGNVTICFVTDHFDFAASRNRPVKETHREVTRDKELQKPRRTFSGTNRSTSSVEPSTLKANDGAKPQKSSQRTKPALSTTSISTEYSNERIVPATSRDDVPSVPENRVNPKSPSKSRTPSSRLPSSQRKRARKDSGDSKLERKRRMTVKEYNNRKSDSSTSNSDPSKVQSDENRSILEAISPSLSTSRIPVENGTAGLTSPNPFSTGMSVSTNESEIAPPIENPERTQTPLANLLAKSDESKNANTKKATSVPCAVPSEVSDVTESFQSLIAAAAAVLPKLPVPTVVMPPVPGSNHDIPESLSESLQNESLSALEGELEEGELPDTEDAPTKQRADCEEKRDRNLTRSPQLRSDKSRSSRAEMGQRDRNNRRERLPWRRDESVSHRTSEQARSSHISSRSFHTSSQHEDRSRNSRKDESYYDKSRRPTKLNSMPASNRSRGSPVRESDMKRASELERSIDPLDLKRILGKSEKR